MRDITDARVRIIADSLAVRWELDAGALTRVLGPLDELTEDDQAEVLADAARALTALEAAGYQIARPASGR
ncbi:hypothetical protein [Actinokineospora spheciospongiae]|uniref:hypothetical protein n=1 Tax=Actinokineospora spheciospongiae TaxID=909613 RepID=UPI000D710B85|nr:hypothetical protein [Actinokineospora spheciospongiae]PWW50253.1 hypothetical protein DFQ13_12315 [Actinokineospora spheciospongiae]